MTDSPNAVVSECDLPDAPEKVWKALTEPKLLAEWLPDALDCETLAAEPNRLLRYRWRGSERDREASVDSVVTFELTGTATGGTHLRVVHHVLARVIAFSRVNSPSGGIHNGPVARGGAFSTLLCRAA